jgi:hypothetical protein
VRGIKKMQLLLGLAILTILMFMGKFYYSSCKNTANEFVVKYLEENNEIHKEDGEYGENSAFNRTIRT